jgi:photosystem II stability/assembly factor-like uncharacterized protein
MKFSVSGFGLSAILAIFMLISGVALAQSGTFTIQTSSVNDEAVARETVARFQAKGLSAYYVKANVPNKGIYYRVRVGRFPSSAEANRAARQLGIRDAFITVFDGPAGTAIIRNLPPGAAPPPRRPDDPPPPIVIDHEKKPDGAGTLGNSEKPVAPGGNEVKPDGRPTVIGPGNDGGKPPVTPAGPPAPVLRIPDRSGEHPIFSTAVPLPPVNPNFTLDNSPWTRQSSPTRTDLRTVFFVNTLCGWIGGGRGTILHTVNGGLTWFEQVTGTRAPVTSVFFLDENRGWAVVGGSLGVDPLGGEADPGLLATTDGGTTWKRIADLDAQAICFANANVGFAAGNYSSVFRTDDGGKTWSKCDALARAVERPTSLADALLTFTGVQFTDEKHGWVSGNFYGKGLLRPAGLFLTDDGGATWIKCPIPFAVTTAEVMKFRFQDAQRGYVVSEVYRGDARFVTVFRTSDGGATWVERRTTVPGYHLTHFVNDRVGWTMGAVMARENAPPLEIGIWNTMDGGASWREEKTLAGTVLYDSFFVSDSLGWAVGQGGTILRYRPQ